MDVPWNFSHSIAISMRMLQPNPLTTEGAQRHNVAIIFKHDHILSII